MRVRIFRDIRFFIHEVIGLVKSPVFLLLTILGNLLIGVFAILFYWLEFGLNPNVKHFIDSLWYCFSTATTTGYGDIVPVTHGGKALSILVMLVGTAIFALYTGLFAEAILKSDKFQKNTDFESKK